MRQSAVIEWLHDEISTFLSGSSLVSLSNPDNHVALAEQRDDQVYPFVAIQEVSSVTVKKGKGDTNVYVAGLDYTSGVLNAVTYARDVRVRLEVIPLTDGDAKLRDDLTEDLNSHLSIQSRKKEYPTDIRSFDVGESSPNERTDDFVRGKGVELKITFTRYEVDDDPEVATEVNLTLNVGDYDEDITEADDPEPFDETFN
jgi:hypothetical protein